MPRLAVTLAAAMLLLSGCAGDGKEPKAAPTPSTPSQSTASPTPSTSADLTIGYGRLGPVEVGMTVAQADRQTGLFQVNPPGPAEGCPTPPLQWRKQFTGVDVIVADGRIVSLGVNAVGPKTSSGVGVGSTLADVKKTFPGLSGPVNAGYGQAGAYAKSGDRWIGFLFGEANETTVGDSSKVTFIELTKGAKPDLMRDGC